MLEINVKEARQRFKELLDRVESGEEISVTRRGHVVARWLPPERKQRALPSLSDFRKSPGATGTPAVQLVREERDER